MTALRFRTVELIAGKQSNMEAVGGHRLRPISSRKCQEARDVARDVGICLKGCSKGVSWWQGGPLEPPLSKGVLYGWSETGWSTPEFLGPPRHRFLCSHIVPHPSIELRHHLYVSHVKPAEKTDMVEENVRGREGYDVLVVECG